MDTQNYYTVLGVRKGSSKTVIRLAFREMVRIYHPDLNPGDEEASRRFRTIKEAYDVLMDPTQRELYDQQLARAAEAQAENPLPSEAQPESTYMKTLLKRVDQSFVEIQHTSAHFSL